MGVKPVPNCYLKYFVMRAEVVDAESSGEVHLKDRSDDDLQDMLTLSQLVLMR